MPRPTPYSVTRVAITWPLSATRAVRRAPSARSSTANDPATMASSGNRLPGTMNALTSIDATGCRARLRRFVDAQATTPSVSAGWVRSSTEARTSRSTIAAVSGVVRGDGRQDDARRASPRSLATSPRAENSDKG